MANVLVALSGGVDSSVAARLLVEQGHAVSGAYMKNWINEDNITGDCPWRQDIEDASRVADQIGIPFRVVNLMRDYRERVVSYLLKGYTEGLTPNPDAMCNREMKFGVFREYAIAEGFDFVATGHYAIRRERVGGVVDVLRGKDRNKDQSYFLALLRQEQVRGALFPVGGLEKVEVRKLARKWGLATAEKKDSQGICFIGEVRMSDFLAAYVPDDPGPIVDVEGRVLGEHRGLHLFTLGQRRGIRVASASHGVAYVVVAKEPETKALVVALESRDAPRLYSSRAVVSGVTCLGDLGLEESEELEGQARYRTRAEALRVCAWDPENRRALIEFRNPQRALTPGQVCAFYRGDVLVGGGFFVRVEGLVGGLEWGATSGVA